MTEELTGLFKASENQESAGNRRSLSGTTQLTNMSTNIANAILKTVDASFEVYKDKVAASKNDNDVMDALINEAFDITTADVEFIRQLDEKTQDSMLKSQQSKRSRAKSKVMTLDNYKAMMVGAIAENLIRYATGKAKSAGGAHHASGSLEYSEEQINEFVHDEDKLRKEIRNVQSKKSIMKSKEGFDEDSERWQELLAAEKLLKEIRDEHATRTVVIDETKDALSVLLTDVDINNLKSADAKKLLERAAALISCTSEEAEEIAG